MRATMPRPRGGVAERSKALVLKTGEGNSSQGSNPCPSAIAVWNLRTVHKAVTPAAATRLLATTLRPLHEFDADEIRPLDEGDAAFAVGGLPQELGALGLEVRDRGRHVVHAEAEVIQAQATVRA